MIRATRIPLPLNRKFKTGPQLRMTALRGRCRTPHLKVRSIHRFCLKWSVATSGCFASAGMGATLACCKVGLDRPLIPTAFVANLFRSARVSRPRRSADWRSPVDALTFGDWETCGRSGRAGQETLPGPAFEVSGSSRAAAADRSLEALAPGHRDGHDHSPSLEPRSGGSS